MTIFPMEQSLTEFIPYVSTAVYAQCVIDRAVTETSNVDQKWNEACNEEITISDANSHNRTRVLIYNYNLPYSHIVLPPE